MLLGMLCLVLIIQLVLLLLVVGGCPLLPGVMGGCPLLPGVGSRETRGCPKKPFKTELLRCMLENLVGETKAEGRNMTFGG